MKRAKNGVAISLVLLASAGGCGAPSTVPIASAPGAGMPPMPKAAWAMTAGAELQYQVRATEGAKSLWIEALVPPRATRLDVPRRMRAFVRDAAVMKDGGWAPLDPEMLTFSCAAPPCTVRYRYLLAEAADRFADKDLALADRAAIYAPVSGWLFRTDGASAGAKYRLHVTTPPGLTFVSGVFRAKETDAYEGLVEKMSEAPYGGFGTFDVRSIEVPGAAIDVAITPGGTGVSSERLVAWIKIQAAAVASYYGGKFPIARLLVIVRAGGSGAIGGGSTMGEGGSSILLSVGGETTEKDLAEDWVTVHEMVHVSFPSVLRPWAEEGLATYVEPIIRARAGLLDRDHVWRDLILGLPKGQPDGEGLDGAPSWGRTYWGGAAFWLLGDVEIRKRTENKRSIDDALRGVVSAGGNVAVTWSLDRALGVGDAAVGTPVLADLYRAMKDKPVTVDLDDLWRRLGVRLERRKVIYDDAAPLASVRKAITGG